MEGKRDLWLRIKGYDFQHLVLPHWGDHVQAAFGGPNASTRAFADKLARKLGWNSRFALVAIEEYKKFLFLGQVAHFPVTPPKVIDQVWHEHLLFTRGYREFCATVLRRDFDHHPELVPMENQTAAFQAQYAATLELYQREFNREPPAEFWGVPKFAHRLEAVTASRPWRDEDARTSTVSDTPLYSYFDSDDRGSAGGHPEFGGERGEGGTWSDPGSPDGHHGADADSSGAGNGGDGDSGGGDGGSGCSSGCGGGGD